MDSSCRNRIKAHLMRLLLGLGRQKWSWLSKLIHLDLVYRVQAVSTCYFQRRNWKKCARSKENALRESIIRLSRQLRSCNTSTNTQQESVTFTRITSPNFSWKNSCSLNLMDLKCWITPMACRERQLLRLSWNLDSLSSYSWRQWQGIGRYRQEWVMRFTD